MQKSHQFSPVILREYDIRGQIGKNLFPDDAYALGLSFGTYIKRKGGDRICVGYDGRKSSVNLKEALIKGIGETGINVDIVGLGPSPMLYFAVKDRMCSAGIMITGSHNPPDYNGFKMLTLKGPVFGQEIQKIGEIAAKGDYVLGNGKIREIDVKDNYIKRLSKSLSPSSKKLKIAWDAGNGAAGEVLRMLVKKIPHEHILLFDEIDGNFPNHHPDPTVDKNLEDLQKAVIENGCDIGIAFDGDADRIGVVDEKGSIIRCDIMIALYAEEVLNMYEGAPIIGDVKCSQVMYDRISALGGNVIMWNTGHSLIKSKMIEEHAPLAGELSGHIFFNDKFYGFDDALYNAIRLINIMINKDKKLSEITSDIPKVFNTPEIRFEVEEDKKFDIVDKIKEKVRKIDDLSINDIDGIRVSNQYGWWLLRASNTQNVLVVRAEANNKNNLQILKEQITKLLASENIYINWEE